MKIDQQDKKLVEMNKPDYIDLVEKLQQAFITNSNRSAKQQEKHRKIFFFR